MAKIVERIVSRTKVEDMTRTTSCAVASCSEIRHRKVVAHLAGSGGGQAQTSSYFSKAAEFWCSPGRGDADL